MNKVLVGVTLGVLCVSLVGCSQSPNETVDETQATVTLDEPSSEGWAHVNGSPLTEQELDYALSRFFGEQFVDARAEYKVRDSLIASRALAQKAQAELSPEVLAQLDVAVNAYREERLIAAYIEATTTPEPVSAQMVSDYYQQHLDEFGAATLSRLQILETSIEQANQTKVALSKQLVELAKSSDWSTLVLPSHIKLLRSSTSAQLAPQIQAAVQSTEVGQASGLIAQGDRLLILKVVNEEQIPPKPLAEVSATIRRRLAATQLSKTVKQLTDDVVSQSDVVKHY